MDENQLSEKKIRRENQPKKVGWLLAFVATLIVGSVIGTVIAEIVMLFPAFQEGGSLSCVTEFMQTMIPFFAMFWCTVLFIRVFCKTSFRSFVLGTGHVKQKKECRKLMGLYVLGMALSILPVLKNISLTTESTRTVLITCAAALIFTWFQTTTEELWFRGLTARFAYGDNIQRPLNVGSVMLVLVSSLLFMAAHIANPEVLSSSGTDVVFAVLTYLVPGIGLMVMDLHYGSLEPGIGIHWLNNLLSFAVITAEVSAGSTCSLFVDHTSANKGLFSLLEVIITYLPIFIYLIIRSRKRKAE